MDRRPIRFRLSDRRIEDAFMASLSPRISDLLDIAGEVYKRDRLVRRPGKRGSAFGPAQQRQLRVEVPVREPEFWIGSDVSQKLCDVLRWLTRDSWEFKFVPFEDQRRQAEQVMRLWSTPLVDGGQVALFSGGLDALIGAARLLESYESVALVAVGTNPRQIRVQRELLHKIARLTDGVVPVHVRASLGGASRLDQERPQRTRAFLNLSIAAAAAQAADASTINICENVIGAMNLPYSPRQIGIDTSRAAHPVSLHKMTELVSRVLDRRVAIVNPLFGMTKARGCRELPSEWLPLVPITVSCDIGFTDRRQGDALLCGRCSSCVLRRQALWAAGLSDLDGQDQYRFDFLKGDPGGEALRAMLAQVVRLRAAVASWPELVEAIPEVDDVIAGLLQSGQCDSELQAQSGVQYALAIYASEWRLVPSPAIQTRIAATRLADAA
jgi:7-cyano-7-deazaguanine synthase in queuosine biosynthesis